MASQQVDDIRARKYAIQSWIQMKWGGREGWGVVGDVCMKSTPIFYTTGRRREVCVGCEVWGGGRRDIIIIIMEPSSPRRAEREARWVFVARARETERAMGGADLQKYARKIQIGCEAAIFVFTSLF